MNALIKLILVSLILIVINSCRNQQYLTCGLGVPDFDLIVNIQEINYLLKSDSITIKGEIIDSLSSEPLIGVNIEIQFGDLKELPITYTDISGNFILGFKYDPNYIIKFSYIGYKQQTYELKHFLQKYFENQSDK